LHAKMEEITILSARPRPSTSNMNAKPLVG
jgi:hypothetical protein